MVCIYSEEQGRSGGGEESGTEWAPFELSLRSSEDSTEVHNMVEKEGGEEVPFEKWRGKVARNHDAAGSFSEIKVSDSELYESAESGDVLTVWARSRSTGWVITVERVRIQATIRRIVE